MEREKGQISPERVWKEFEDACQFKMGLNLYRTVEVNENFYIGKQWEGVQANGLPTPVYNFIKRVVLFLVASTASDSLKMAATPLSGADERLTQVIDAQFEALFEHNKLGKLTREFMRNAAVDGDACLYSWFDPEAETGQTARGAIRVEVLENTRVAFGNPNDREVQDQPWILISRRERLEQVREQAKEHGGDAEAIIADSDETGDRFDTLADDGKVTTVTRFWKEGGTVRCIKIVHGAVVRPAWDTEMKRYPLVWMNWEIVKNCYHGQAAVTGMIPNQIAVNKSMAALTLYTLKMAFPTVVYDRTRVDRWTSGVGKAIPVNGGDINGVAKVLDPATVSPQVMEIIDRSVSMTKEFMGATDAALGDTKPDNTSAIIALQKASSVPMELTRQNFYQCLEDLGRIWLDQMRCYYGIRYVDLEPSEEEKQAAAAVGLPPPSGPRPTPFDFSALEGTPLSIKLDVGGSAYWSEIAQVNTLDNLFLNGHISLVEYLERMPSGYVAQKQELIDGHKADPAAPGGAPVQSGPPELTAGFETLARKMGGTGLPQTNSM